MSPLFATLGFAEAQSTTIGMIETVHYNYTFELSDGVIRIAPSDGGPESGPLYHAAETPDTGTYTPYLALGFWHYGSDVLDFEGQTLDLHGLLSSPPGPIEEASYDFSARPGYADPYGHITFGANNSITDWRISGDLPDAGEGESHSASAELISDWWNSVNFDSFAGREAYGLGQYNQYGGTFWTSPGRWVASTRRLCFAEDGSPMPCPDPVIALAEPLAAVPLPPSLLLLFSGLLGVGALRSRPRLAG